jgi:hypothetical protein
LQRLDRVDDPDILLAGGAGGIALVLRSQPVDLLSEILVEDEVIGGH